MTIDDRCFWHKIAEDEKELNDIKEIINEYKKIGCYDCDGYKRSCSFYDTKNEK